MILKLKRTPGIYLTGFMASGKTTIGRLLADELGWQFVDLDKEIEAQQGISIAEIFDTRGEQEFRRIETEAIRAHLRLIERGRPAVIAFGGGAFVQPENFTMLENNGITIWLDCPLETVRKRVAQASHRPLARDAQRLDELYRERQAAYARADYRIPIDSDEPSAAVAAILALPLFS
ncbi:MAG: shikimate kinase [Acidobacteriia bacterium]|nr:shikimate kinase [Terriglobia bacterium]